MKEDVFKALGDANRELGALLDEIGRLYVVFDAGDPSLADMPTAQDRSSEAGGQYTVLDEFRDGIRSMQSVIHICHLRLLSLRRALDGDNADECRVAPGVDPKIEGDRLLSEVSLSRGSGQLPARPHGVLR